MFSDPSGEFSISWKGIRDGLIDGFVSSYTAIKELPGQIKNDPIGTVKDIAYSNAHFSPWGTALYAYDYYQAYESGGAYGIAHQYGGQLGQASQIAIGAGVSKLLKSPRGGVAIGEDMQKRVTPYANENNLSTYGGLECYGRIKRFSPGLAKRTAMIHNKMWIKYQVFKRVDIYDIGPKGVNIRSDYYAMERSVVDGYSKYHRCY